MGAALVALVALCWTWLWFESARMTGMAMPGMEGMQMSHLQMMGAWYAPWSGTLAIYLFFMWFVMMMGMMIPSAAPIILLYMGVARHAAGAGQRFASAAWFLAGYLSAWATFSALATLAHWLLESLAWMTSTMQTASRPVAALALFAAGIWQWLPVKDVCLSRCRSPLAFIQQHGGFAQGRLGSLKLGMLHGWYCVGCCWLMMLVLFVVGVMNIAWIAVLMMLVLVEKLAPGGRWIARVAGVAAVLAAALHL